MWENAQIQATFPKSSGIPASPQKWEQTNTVLIDDTCEKARAQPYNLVELPEFVGENVENDTVLAVLIDYLDTLSRQVDVSRYIRRVPFQYEVLKERYSAPDYGDVLSQASDESDNLESFDSMFEEKDVRACSEVSDECDPEMFDPASQEFEKAIGGNGKEKGKPGKPSWTAVNNQRATEAVTGRPSDASLDEDEKATRKPGAAQDAAVEGPQILVKNLDYSTTKGELASLFKGFSIKSIYIPTHQRTGQPFGHGFVRLSTEAETKRAIPQLSGKNINGRKVSIQLHGKPRRKKKSIESESSGSDGGVLLPASSFGQSLDSGFGLPSQ